jgi:hypothetical protein
MPIYSDGDMKLSQRLGTAASCTDAGVHVLGETTQVPRLCCAAILALIRKSPCTAEQVNTRFSTSVPSQI